MRAVSKSVFWGALLAAALCCAVLPCGAAHAGGQSYMFLIGLPVITCLDVPGAYDYGVAPFVYGGSSYVPVRFFIDISGAAVERADDTAVVVDLPGGSVLEVYYGPPSVKLDGRELESPGPPLVVSGRLMLPARLVGRVFGYEVQWVEPRYEDSAPMVLFCPLQPGRGPTGPAVSRSGSGRYALYEKVLLAEKKAAALLVLGSARIDPPDEDRYAGNLFNSRLAAQKVDGTVLQPGEVFSFNAATGPREPWNGFVWGLGLVGPDMGSGVCRTATVLFQAARAAGLEVVERHTHVGGEVPYAGPEDDAAVQWGVADLKFANPYSFPVKVRVTAVGKTGLEAKVVRVAG